MFRRPKRTFRKDPFSSRLEIPFPIILVIVPTLLYLYLGCAFPDSFFSPFPISHRIRSREHVDIHAATVKKLSVDAKAALSQQKDIPKLELLDAVEDTRLNIPPSNAHKQSLKVEEMNFAVEMHGFQCLVYTSQAKEEKYRAKSNVDVTWVTQLTTDRIPVFKKMLDRWTGPISAALYSPDVSKDVKDIEDLLDRVDFHIVGASQGLYPVNTLRNVAINKAKTDFIIMADVDFVPSAGLYEAAKTFVEKLASSGAAHEKKVYVLPAFEIDGEDQTVPLDFEGLKGMGARIHQVHNDKGRSIAHKYTEYDKWIEASEPYKVSYKFPYEPYILAPRTIPRFDVRFFGYGNDKASHNYELNAAGYEFWVFPKHFVVHIRHSQGIWIHQTFLDPRERLSRTLTTFLHDCDRRYSKVSTMSEENVVFEPLPDSLNFTMEVGILGASCDATCSRFGKTCHAQHSNRINLCKVLEQHFQCLHGCNREFFGADLPALNTQRMQCLINNAPLGAPFTCDSVYEFSRRLCPCGS